MRVRLNQTGFTIVELVVICPILMATIAFTVNYLFDQYAQLSIQQAQINIQARAQIIVYAMQDDIFYSNAFSSTTHSNVSDSYAPSGGWQSSSNPTVFIASNPALTNSHASTNPQPVYINTYGCGANITDNDVLYNNVIIWASGTNLYKRVISAPSSTATCGKSYIAPSCPAGHTTSTCPADILYTTKLGAFTVTYYDANGLTTTNPDQSTEVKISVTLADRAFSQPLTATSSITIKKVN